MKTKLYILLLILPLLFLQQGCNKDYPKDIPKWLKEKIKEREKECKKDGCSCSNGGLGCWTIFEWDENGTVYYVIDYGSSGVGDNIFAIVYDVNGSVLCSSEYNRVDFGDIIAGCKDACPNFLKYGNKTRDIWGN